MVSVSEHRRGKVIFETSLYAFVKHAGSCVIGSSFEQVFHWILKNWMGLDRRHLSLSRFYGKENNKILVLWIGLALFLLCPRIGENTVSLETYFWKACFLLLQSDSREIKCSWNITMEHVIFIVFTHWDRYLSWNTEGGDSKWGWVWACNPGTRYCLDCLSDVILKQTVSLWM